MVAGHEGCVTYWYYIAGVALGMLLRWSRWKQRTKQPWLTYWAENSGGQVSAALIAVALTFLWTEHYLQGTFNYMLTSITAVQKVGLAKITCSPPTAVAAGCALDLFGKILITRAWAFTPGKKKP